MPPDGGIQILQLLALLGAFALLIRDTAAGLASGLAGCLAFAAATVLFTKSASFDRLDMCHSNNLHKNIPLNATIFLRQSQQTQHSSRFIF